MNSASAPSEFLSAIFGAAAAVSLRSASPGTAALAVLKGGKRARAAVAGGGAALSASDLSSFLDGVVAGGAFEKLEALPAWGSDEGEAISDDEL